jgi:hypothetical protein
MAFRKKLSTGDTVEAWIFETDIETGISVGVFDSMFRRAKMLVCVEEFDGKKKNCY